jgi:hypothetical protein
MRVGFSDGMREGAGPVTVVRDGAVLARDVAEHGFAGPTRVLSARECRQLLRAVAGSHAPPPMEWNKGYGATSRAVYELAVHPKVLEPVVAALGDDIIPGARGSSPGCPARSTSGTRISRRPTRLARR